MNPVVFTGEDDVAVLQQRYPARQPKIRMRPLVDLIGQRHKDGQSVQVTVQGVRVIDLPWREGEEVEGHVSQRDDGQHAVIPVCLDEVVPCDGCGIDVVFPKRSDERLSKDG